MIIEELKKKVEEEFRKGKYWADLEILSEVEGIICFKQPKDLNLREVKFLIIEEEEKILVSISGKEDILFPITPNLFVDSLSSWLKELEKMRLDWIYDTVSLQLKKMGPGWRVIRTGETTGNISFPNNNAGLRDNWELEFEIDPDKRGLRVWVLCKWGEDVPRSEEIFVDTFTDWSLRVYNLMRELDYIEKYPFLVYSELLGLPMGETSRIRFYKDKWKAKIKVWRKELGL